MGFFDSIKAKLNALSLIHTTSENACGKIIIVLEKNIFQQFLLINSEFVEKLSN